MGNSRLREIRKAKKLTLEKLAELSGISESMLSRMEAGTRGVTLEHLPKLARALDVRQAELVEEDLEVPRLVPLLSWVSAGRLADSNTQVPSEDVPLLPIAGLSSGDYFALRVSGDSMDRLSPDGSVIIVNRTDRELITGKPYVFSIRGEATYKLWRPKPPRLQPFSSNLEHEPVYLDGRRGADVVGRVRRSVLDL